MLSLPRQATGALDALLAAGADIDGEDAAGEAPITKALKRDLPHAFHQLAQRVRPPRPLPFAAGGLLTATRPQGAGRSLIAQEVRPFIEKCACRRGILRDLVARSSRS